MDDEWSLVGIGDWWEWLDLWGLVGLIGRDFLLLEWDWEWEVVWIVGGCCFIWGGNGIINFCEEFLEDCWVFLLIVDF